MLETFVIQAFEVCHYRVKPRYAVVATALRRIGDYTEEKKLLLELLFAYR